MDTSALAFAFHANSGDLELAHTAVTWCRGYTYMAGDTKLSPREMLAAGGS